MHNSLLEALTAMQDKESLRRDMYDVAAAAREMLQKKYIGRMRAAIRETHANARQSPPREARLLEAFKPFLPTEKHEAVNRCANLFLALDACKRVSGAMAAEIQTASSAYGDPSVHPDGVYDIDAQCNPMRVQAAARAARPSDAAMALLMLLIMEETAE